jgi:secreted trypsin-like serine protease
MLRIILALVLVSSPASAGPLVSPIVGGSLVEPGAWPDVVAVFTADGGVCTGTLLEADLVVTAAHCVDASPQEVLVGSVDLTKPDGQRRRVKWSRAYPSWIDRYDVGVVMLEHPVFARARAVAQGCTARQGLARGTPLQIVGFGLTTTSGTGESSRLREATIRVTDPTCTSDDACRPDVAPGGELVAGGEGVDACFGDSGGPAYIATSHGPALLGIVSRGTFATLPCGDGGIYVRADKVTSWIENVTGRDLRRVPCDGPADDAGGLEPAGCTAGGGALESAFAIVLGALWILTLRRARRRVRRRGLRP